MTDQEKVLQCFRTPYLDLKAFVYTCAFITDKGITNYQSFVSNVGYGKDQLMYIEYWQLSRPNDPMAVKPTVDPK